ncbi:MAG: hypothetical protein AB7G37_10070 [Solirubrobacteraceae bacterium]
MSTPRPPVQLDQHTLWGIGSAVLLLIGSVTPWATAGPFSKNGIDGDGVITLVLAIAIGALILLRRAPRVALGLALLSAAVTLYDTIDIGRVGGDSIIDVSVGWGLVLALIASLSLTAWGVVTVRRPRPDAG